MIFIFQFIEATVKKLAGCAVLTCLRGPSKMLSVISELLRALLEGKSPMYLSVEEKAKHASSASSSLPTNFRSSGCLMGSLVCFQRSSPRPREPPRAAVSAIAAFDILLFAGALENYQREISYYVYFEKDIKKSAFWFTEGKIVNLSNYGAAD